MVYIALRQFLQIYRLYKEKEDAFFLLEYYEVYLIQINIIFLEFGSVLQQVNSNNYPLTLPLSRRYRDKLNGIDLNALCVRKQFEV